MKYSKEFKEEALKLSDEIGLKKAAQQLRSVRNIPPDEPVIIFQVCQ